MLEYLKGFIKRTCGSESLVFRGISSEIEKFARDLINLAFKNVYSRDLIPSVWLNLCSMNTRDGILRWPISRATNVDGFIHAGADSFHRAALKGDSGSCKRTQCTRIESSLFLSPHPSLIIPKESSHERKGRTIRIFFFLSFFFFIVVEIKISEKILRRTSLRKMIKIYFQMLLSWNTWSEEYRILLQRKGILVRKFLRMIEENYQQSRSDWERGQRL